MDFLIDVHLPISLSKFLDKQSGRRSIHVNQILQKWNSTDADISKYADNNNLVVITKDSDFISSHLINKTPQRLIRIVLGNISNAALLIAFESHLLSILSLSAIPVFYVELGQNQLTVIN